MATIRSKNPLEYIIPFSFLGALLVAAFWFQGNHSASTEKVKTPPPSEDEETEVTDVDQPFLSDLTVYNREKAFKGLTLYSVVGKAEVLLFSMEGKVLHRWPVDAQRARLLPNGNLLVLHGSKWGTRVSPWKELKFTVREYTWDGDVAWEYPSSERIHHDVQRLSNGDTIFAVRRNLAPQYMQLITHPKRLRFDTIRTDSLVEINREGAVTWRWNAEEVLDVNSCGNAGCERENAADWTHINTVSPLPNNRWFDAGDTRFRPGNILTVLRNWWEMKIIDKKSKDVVWSFSGDYRGGLSGGHDAYMIEPGLPGAGNILVFDNGRKLHKGESIILEIEPPTGKLVWKYEDGTNFFSNSAGSVQRLPNGNTFISDDLSGRAFEVTPEGEIVWELRGNFRTARSQKYPLNYTEKFSTLQ
ncbi:MAG: aryl-sulfate sulfotransferase [Bdellovibrionales bacterium]|nr:aryl-sulfate sulfotransferase [Bdellovibrionales bacterium]